METPLIFNVQKFSLHDGPGIRTTIFFKGCPISCAWCHNPESQSYKQEKMPNKFGKLSDVGTPYTVSELVNMVSKDEVFYRESNGGITLSGGEVMTQDLEFITDLVKALKSQGLSVAIDTCGVCDFERFEAIAPYVDLFLYDLKLLDDDLHKKYVGVSNKCVLRNLKKLSQLHAKIWLRLIIMEGINSSIQDMQDIVDFLQQENIHVERIYLLPYHDLGRDKYRRLERDYDHEQFKCPSLEQQEKLQAYLTKAGYNVKIGG